MDPHFIAAEKARLLAMEKRLLDLIRSVKEGQNANMESQIPSANVEVEYAYDLPEMEHIATEETMSFSFGPEIEKEVANIEPKRRKSLVDVHTGTKPNLPVKKTDKFDKAQDNNGATSTQASGNKASAGETKEEKKRFVLPTGQRLTSLSKLHVSCYTFLICS